MFMNACKGTWCQFNIWRRRKHLSCNPPPFLSSLCIPCPPSKETEKGDGNLFEGEFHSRSFCHVLIKHNIYSLGNKNILWAALLLLFFVAHILFNKPLWNLYGKQKYANLFEKKSNIFNPCRIP